MNRIQIFSPKKVVFGADSLDQFVDDYLKIAYKRLYLVTIPQMTEKLRDTLSRLTGAGVATRINTTILDEPTFEDFERLIAEAAAFGADSVVGVGGGSVMDIAKLIAAQLHNEQSVDEVLSHGFQKKRSTYVACLPTTAGTGSEVSPNAIFVNSEGRKIGIISPELVPDAAYIDPALTITVPPSVTAATGIDALAHCLEAYTNKHAHPVIDLLALKGVNLIGGSLLEAYRNGRDLEARTNVALGSMYGGMCLGPVNTTAVHALAYPLSTEFHIPHGLSVALLLPYVMEFNLTASVERYEAIAVALGSQETGSKEDIAASGVKIIKDLIKNCGLPGSLAEVNIPFEAIEKLAAEAIQIQRLLKNNPREISVADAKDIYTNAFNMQGNEEKI
jgi:alcohol dehydrogenase